MRNSATRIVAGAMLAVGAFTFVGVSPAAAAPAVAQSTTGGAVDDIVDLANDLLDEAYDLLQCAADLLDDTLDEVLG
ncbi:hypothetical protein [Kribbella deserti]|uniref:Secreted protein n=1 Tax=Kribbella deserti TaxID=1926257 RepID=A0ABV6QIF3_9ACTN